MSYTKSQLQHQKELEVARERIRNRKKRTRRLIQFGAIAESFPGSDRLTPEEFQNLLSSRLSPSGRRNPPEEDQDISQADNAGCVISLAHLAVKGSVL
jgi:hypothetical protein